MLIKNSLNSVFYQFIEEGKIQTCEDIEKIYSILNSYDLDLMFNEWKDKIANDGVRKIVFIFDAFVIKLTSLDEIREEQIRQNQFLSSLGVQTNIFLSSTIFYLDKKIPVNKKKYHFSSIDCICFQKKVESLTVEEMRAKAANKTLILNRQWLKKFIKLNYSKDEQKLLNNFLFSIDLTNNNIGYDENNNPIIYDW